ncbi:hypothetical protein DOTSEDRAFT_52745 [Dothistroma septosporum NZE10]|uniref:CAF1-domain-containing protein n=1 Tax=Dothistroma septosporum (strain NZE10 / CBS 128990) TaxID=675120 RepID=N1PRB7_DOTSN|nr:hypothetical protein DOTSEDRAFT_52745 [Dothistroma septosporum NZE10]
MDVDKVSFYPLLLDIISDISEAHFVAIDLELSGVPSRGSWGKDSGKPTIQQRYLEIKEAAERYQILQIGITCVDQNVHDGKYTLKPYNFDLSPVINERGLDVERIFSFQSGAAEFLLGVGFDIGRPFRLGVPYLSRAESKVAREKFAMRQDKNSMADIQIKPTETESLAFLERVRGDINTWVKSRNMDTPAYLNIAPVGYETIHDGQRQAEELSRFEKRLVHQLVRAEFPELVTVSKKGFIQIVRFNKEREERIAADRRRDLEERIGRQKGFRWIIEALHGSNISNLDLRECAKDSVTGEPVFADMDDYKAQFNRAQGMLRGNPKVIVGHNCFLDMVYIYRTFIGELPDNVEEFQRRLHKLWPVVVDTKYMTTHNCGDISPISSLEQIAEQLSAQTTPILDTDKQHTKYNTMAAFHEAGFDSFLTAQVAVKLSAKLDCEGAYIDVDDKGQSAAPTDITNGIANMKLTGDALFQLQKEQKVNGNGGVTKERGFTPSVPGAQWKRIGDPTLEPTSKDDLFEYDPTNLKHHFTKQDLTIAGGMPGFGSDFWHVYGNKFRVFGTQEGVCALDDSIESPIVSDEDGGVEV